MSRNLKLAITCLVLLVTITLISALPVGFSVDKKTVSSVSKDLLDSGDSTGQLLHAITITNSFLPRQYTLPRAQACLYNSERGYSEQLQVNWVGEDRVRAGLMDDDTVELGIETKKVQLVTGYHRVPKPMPVDPQFEDRREFDSIYVFFEETRGFDNGYVSCYELQEDDLAFGERITLV